MRRPNRGYLLAALVVSLCLACSCAYVKPRYTLKQGRDTWVKVVPANKKLTPLDHPQNLDPEKVRAALASIDFFKPGVFAIGGNQGKNLDLFTEEELDTLAAPLAEAFALAGPDTWVDFSITSFRGQTFIGNFIRSDGVMFFTDGKLNVALRNISLKVSPDEEVNTFDPTKSYRSMVKLTALKGQELKDDNWLVLDLDKVAEEEPAVAVPGPSDSGAAPPSAPPVEEKSVKERLTDLRELYEEGLITEDEYNEKRKEILEDL